jgi:hypothetical protein
MIKVDASCRMFGRNPDFMDTFLSAFAWDCAMSYFSRGQQLYEGYYSSDPVRLANTLYDL